VQTATHHGEVPTASDRHCRSTGGFNSRAEDDVGTSGGQVGDIT
jgi:hypothetical protein